ncbi:MAG: SCP2 sterol-binding domain-containing protein [Alphaproteobacteria bacterium]|nr:SCP2 sterol-binding domain-containing protein [Alphaproteobacteria bacterium]
MSLDSITTEIRQKLALAPQVNARVKFDMGDDGIVFVDATQTPAVISHDDAEADVVLIASAATFEGLMNGTQDPNMAFMMGKLKIKGSMGLAMKLNSILEG